MAKSAKALREERAALAARTVQLRDAMAGQEPTAEQLANFDQLHKDFERLSREIERADVVERMQSEAPPTRGVTLPSDDNDRRARKRNLRHALATWARASREGVQISDEDRENANLCGMPLRANEISLQLVTGDFESFRRDLRLGRLELRADQSALLGSAGAYLIPEGFSGELDRAMLEFGGMREACRVIRTSSGNDVPWPTTDDTANMGRMISENTEAPQTGVTFGATTLHAYKATSDIVNVPVELIEDSFFDVAGMVTSMLAERLARLVNYKATNGTGAAEPTGILQRTTQGGTTTASATAFTRDELIKLKHSVGRAYRRGARWMLNDTSIRDIKLFVDAVGGRPLWQPDISRAEPGFIDGDPYTINDDLPSPASAQKPVLYGNFQKFIIREAGSVRLRRLDERYAEKDQVGFVGFFRFDTNLIDAGQHPIKHLLMKT